MRWNFWIGPTCGVALMLGGLSLGGCGHDSTTLPPPPPPPPPPPGETFTGVRSLVSGITDASLVAAFEESGGRLLVGSSYGEVLVQDEGVWHTEPLGAPLIVTGIWGDPGGAPMAVAGNTLFVRNADATWSPASLPVESATLLDIWGLDGEHVWITGSGGVILTRVGGAWQLAETQTTEEIWGIGGSGPGDLVAVGQNGQILASSDGGLTWQAVQSPTPHTLFAVAFDGPGRAVAVGSGGVILRMEDGQWQTTESPTDVTLFDVRSNGPGAFVMVGNHGTIVEGDGRNWHVVPVPGARENLRAVVGEPGRRRAVGWSGTVLSEASGWNTALSGGRLYGLHVPASGSALAVGTGGLAYERVGATWRVVPLPTPASLYGIDGPNGEDRIAVGDSAVIMHYEHGEWNREFVVAGALLRSVWYDGTHALAVGEAGVVMARENGNWHAVASGTTRFLRQVAGNRWDRLFVVGDSGTALLWDGNAFTPILVPTEENLRGIDPSNDSDIWLVGDAGTILRGDGVTWTRQLPPAFNDIRAVHRVDGISYIAGDFGQVYSFVAGEWSRLPSEQSGFWLAMAGAGELVLVGEVGRISEGVR